MKCITKEQMIDILEEIADCIDNNNSESIRHLQWVLQEEIEAEEEG